MAKPTLLEVTQDILSDADGDEVNSISDTFEATQCATVIRDSFRNIVDVYDIKHHEKLSQLTATGASTPTQMNRPANLHSIEWIKYDKKESASDTSSFQEVYWVTPDEFVRRTAGRNDSDSNVETVTLDSGFVLKVRNEQAPSYYTTFEGYENFIFDAYDSDLETNLQASKSLAYGVSRPSLSLTDTATIDLPENLITLLRNDARAFYFDLYKGGTTTELDRRRRRSETRAQRKKHITKNQQATQTGPNFGRK